MSQIVEMLVNEENVHPTRIIACHMDLVTEDWEYTQAVAEFGVFIEYDGFGHPCPTEGVYVADEQRIAAVERLVERGYAGQLLFAHDIGLPARMARFGGPGWDHISNVIVPSLRRRGFSIDDLKAILVTNPQRAFALSLDASPHVGATARETGTASR